MRRVAIAPVVGILLAALTSTIGASGVNGAYTCSSSSSCLSANQSAPAGATGAAIKGAATNSYGVRGVSTNSAGTLGQSAAGSVMYPGIEGESTNNNGSDVAGGFGLTGAVKGGTAPAYGVYAFGSTVGVYGTTTGSGQGSTNGFGLAGFDYSGNDQTPSSNAGVYGSTVNGIGGVVGLSHYSPGVTAFSGFWEAPRCECGIFAGGVQSAGTFVNPNGQSVQLANYNGESEFMISGTAGSAFFNIDDNGSETLSGTLTSASLNVAATDSNGNQSYTRTTDSGYLFDGAYKVSGSLNTSGFNFDNKGDETLTGTLMTSKSTYSRTRGVSGAEKIAYGARTTAPSIDDVGGGQLTQGSAYVRLDADLADVIDRRAEYRVFITPEGESNQLYVTQKSPSGFVVREAHGGRSNIAFDYRIVAKPFDDDGRRLAVAPIVRPIATSAKSTEHFAPAFANPAAVATPHRAMHHTTTNGSRILDPFEQLKVRLGPAKFAAALAEFKRQQR